MSIEAQLAEYEKYKSDIIEWDKYLYGLKFQTMDDMAEFAKEYVIAQGKEPTNKLLTYKLMSIKNLFFTAFLKAFFEQGMILDVYYNTFSAILEGRDVKEAANEGLKRIFSMKNGNTTEKKTIN